MTFQTTRNDSNNSEEFINKDLQQLLRSLWLSV
jgi:hypothetical protein